MKKALLSAAAVVAALALPGSPALAQTNEIVIGITLSTTGPAAALGIPERNALDFVPKEIGGMPIKLIVLDDGGDPTAATTNARRFVTESRADTIMGKVLYAHMKAHAIKTVGYIGYSDSYGDLWVNDFKAQAVPLGLTMVDEERFARPDTSVTGQVLKLVAANPDAILIGASGTAAALPQT